MNTFRFDVVSLFPEYFDNFYKLGIIGKAFQQNLASLNIHNPRNYSLDKHRKVDDEPYGGGPGMVLKPEPYFAALEAIPTLENKAILMMTPQGESISQADFLRWSKKDQLILICGSYEGFDERIRSLADEEVSLGDFVLTSGELPAMTIINGVMRLLTGVVGCKESLLEESHSEVLLEHPQYTRPASFKGLDVPSVLRSGNHQAVKAWRQSQREINTKSRRPDLYDLWSQNSDYSLIKNNQLDSGRGSVEPTDFW